jgi:hypothetical protein
MLLCLFNIIAPVVAKIKWLSARRTTTSGNPAIKNPKLEISATEIAISGDINIAIKIATWLASVKDAGSMIIFGANIGIIIPIALKRPATQINITLFVDFVVDIVFNPLNS